jgi:hypothetical protein
MNAEAGAVGEGSRGLLYRFEAHAIVSADDATLSTGRGSRRRSIGRR